MISEHFPWYNFSLGHLILLFLPLIAGIVGNLYSRSEMLKKLILLQKKSVLMRGLVIESYHPANCSACA